MGDLRVVSRLPALVASAVAAVALFGHLISASALYTWGTEASMSVGTAVGVIAVAVARVGLPHRSAVILSTVVVLAGLADAVIRLAQGESDALAARLLPGPATALLLAVVAGVLLVSARWPEQVELVAGAKTVLAVSLATVLAARLLLVEDRDESVLAATSLPTMIALLTLGLDVIRYAGTTSSQHRSPGAVLAATAAPAVVCTAGIALFSRASISVDVTILVVGAALGLLSVITVIQWHRSLAASERAAAEARRLGVLFSTSSVAMLEVDASGVVLRANGAASDLLSGRSRVARDSPTATGRTTGHTTGDAVGPPIDAGVGRMVGQLLEQIGEVQPGVRVVTELELAPHDVKHLGVQVDVLEGETAATRVISLVDLTAEYAAAERLRRQQVELERANHSLERFAFAASHDLQEPLRTISVGTEILARRNADHLDGASREMSDHVLHASQRMSSLITDLLEWSRVARRPAPTAPLDPRDALDAVTADLQALIDESGASVQVPDSMPAVAVEAVEMRQLWTNLLSNSIRHRSSERPQIRISVTSNGGWAMFEVTDNGVGVAPEHHERIFVPFERLQLDGRSEIGTGLGLALCRAVVEHRGGEIGIRSELGQGATFWFSLPVWKWR